jgi:hypothetical protein
VYGQRHAREIASARALVRHFRVPRHTVLTVPLHRLVRSALTDVSQRLPVGRSRPGRIPSTYVPARNTVLLSLALAAAETDGAREIFIGANAIDYSGYPDRRSAGHAHGHGIRRTVPHSGPAAPAEQGGDRSPGRATQGPMGADVELLRGGTPTLWKVRRVPTSGQGVPGRRADRSRPLGLDERRAEPPSRRRDRNLTAREAAVHIVSNGSTPRIRRAFDQVCRVAATSASRLARSDASDESTGTDW